MMKVRWPAYLLTAVLAAPLCCCGFTAFDFPWHAEEETGGCPACVQHERPSEQGESEGGRDCLCAQHDPVRYLVPADVPLPLVEGRPLTWADSHSEPVIVWALLLGDRPVLARDLSPPRWCGVRLHLLNQQQLL